jgi:Tripartite ATP-independent periplasmic transporter, DctM component
VLQRPGRTPRFIRPVALICRAVEELAGIVALAGIVMLAGATAITVADILLRRIFDFAMIGMILLTVPFVFPLVAELQIDPIWFGILLVTVVELGLFTPPIGMNLFVLRVVADNLPLRTIIRGTCPSFSPKSSGSPFCWRSRPSASGCLPRCGDRKPAATS